MGYYAYGVLAGGASIATTIALYLLFTGKPLTRPLLPELDG